MSKLDCVTCFLVGLFVSVSTLAQSTDDVIERGQDRLQQGVESQKKVDKIFDETQSMLIDYQAKLESVDSLDVYNQLLKAQLDNQLKEITVLEQSILDAAVIERQIAPLLVRMIDSLGKFIAADRPFLLAERQQRVENLRNLLVRSDVSAAEKCRRVFEAYTIENDFGRTLESYTDQIEINGQSLDANILRVGRIALMFELIDQDQTGYWDQTSKQWREDSSASFKRFVDQGLKVANKETAPEMINIPVLLTTTNK